jgi:uncharacterized SAM-binding protein YcdF (DUF218 family)
MLYFIKVICGFFLLPPGIFISILAWLSWRIYRKQRGLGMILTGVAFLFYLCSTALVSNVLINTLENNYRPPARVTGDVIVILGGGSTLDTPNLGGKGHLSGSAANRLLTGVQLYHQLEVPIIYSGGQVFRTSGPEAEVAQRILLELGIPDHQIITETRSLNTTENARFVKKILDKNHFRHPILVTSAFHMPRAIKQFQKARVAFVPYPADYHTNLVGRFDIYQLTPSADALEEVSLALKEYVGILVSRWY